MPTFRITAPDGKTYRITAPEGTTQEQAMAQLQSHLGTPAEADPNRGVIDKASEFYEGTARGMIQNMLGLTRHLPGDELPFLPESARQARRQARGEVATDAYKPAASNYESAGRFTGGDVLPAFIGPAWGGRIAGAAAGAGMRNFPTLAQLVYALHDPIGALLGRTVLHDAGALEKIKAVTSAMAPEVAAGVRALVGGAERLGTAEATRSIGSDDASNTQTTPTPPSTAPRAPPRVPDPGTPGGTGTPGPRPDVTTDVPTAARSGRGDRLKPLYPGAND